MLTKQQLDDLKEKLRHLSDHAQHGISVASVFYDEFYSHMPDLLETTFKSLPEEEEKVPVRRDPCEIIKQVLEHVPEEFDKLRASLGKIYEDARYRPPEAQIITWADLRDLLNDTIGMPPHEDWQREIYRIVTMKEPPTE